MLTSICAARMDSKVIKTYFQLTKPGIIMGNAITAVAGFLLASKGHVDYGLFLAMLVGLSAIIASACVFNNYIDRDIDKKMKRTKNRALARGQVAGPQALAFATLLGLAGTIILARYTNKLALFTALTGFFFYVVVYGFWKRRSSWGTVVGSISGAVPPVVGYCAVSNRLDSGAIILFIIVVLWQMPHFFAIAIYRLNDYASAGIPVLPVSKGILNTKVNMLLYTVAFVAATLALSAFGFTGHAYLVVASLLGFAWLRLCIKGFWATDNNLWARKMFRLSLIIITVLSITISLEPVLP
jgi:protoheme IX farnesyltransferase